MIDKIGGCGAFGGFYDLKAIIQMMASAQANRKVKYYTFGVKGLAPSVKELASMLIGQKTTVGKFPISSHY